MVYLQPQITASVNILNHPAVSYHASMGCYLAMVLAVQEAALEVSNHTKCRRLPYGRDSSSERVRTLGARQNGKWRKTACK